MEISSYEIVIKHHVIVRAIQRGITPDLIENCIKHGKVDQFGKDYLKFISKSVIAIGQICSLEIKIITIERRRK